MRNAIDALYMVADATLMAISYLVAICAVIYILQHFVWENRRPRRRFGVPAMGTIYTVVAIMTPTALCAIDHDDDNAVVTPLHITAIFILLMILMAVGMD